MLDPRLIIWGIAFVGSLIAWRIMYVRITKQEKIHLDEALIKFAEEVYRAKVKEEQAKLSGKQQMQLAKKLDEVNHSE